LLPAFEERQVILEHLYEIVDGSGVACVKFDVMHMLVPDLRHTDLRQDNITIF
jgi:hypothetical protein